MQLALSRPPKKCLGQMRARGLAMDFIARSFLGGMHTFAGLAIGSATDSMDGI